MIILLKYFIGGCIGFLSSRLVTHVIGDLSSLHHIAIVIALSLPAIILTIVAEAYILEIRRIK